MKKLIPLMLILFSTNSYADSLEDTNLNHSCLTRYAEINDDTLRMSPHGDGGTHICISGNLDILNAENLTQLPTKVVDFKMTFTSGEFKQLYLYCYSAIWTNEDNYQRGEVNARQVHIDNPILEGEKLSSAECRIYPIRNLRY